MINLLLLSSEAALQSMLCDNGIRLSISILCEHGVKLLSRGRWRAVAEEEGLLPFLYQRGLNCKGVRTFSGTPPPATGQNVVLWQHGKGGDDICAAPSTQKPEPEAQTYSLKDSWPCWLPDSTP